MLNIFQIYPHLVPACLPIAQIALTGSVYMILAIAIERYLALSRYAVLKNKDLQILHCI